LKHKPERLQLLILSHLSQNNNHPDIVNKLFTQHSSGVKVVIASRHKETELFNIEGNPQLTPEKTVKRLKENKAQLSLFEF
jgi:hypothetical protein